MVVFYAMLGICQVAMFMITFEFRGWGARPRCNRAPLPATPPHYTSCKMAAVKGVLGKVSGVLLDLSGTLFVENAPTPGALAALDKSVPIYISMLL